MLQGGPAKRAPKKKRSGFKPSAAGRAYAAPKYTPAPSRSDAAQRHGARTPKPKPYRPTPKQVEASRIQAKAYKSQGKAVKKVSHVQKAQGVGRPTGGRTLVTRVEAARKVQRGRRREREAKAISKLVGFDPRDRYNNTPRKTKTNVMPVPKGLKKAYDLGYLETDKAKLKTAGFNPPGLDEAIISAPKHAIKYGVAPAAGLAVNAAEDVKELAVTTPSSAAELAKTAVSDPEKLPGMLAEPYKEFFKGGPKDWVKHAYDKPVSSYLMFAPAAKVPGRTAGKVARKTGKQTLERTPATLPGTTLKQTRIGSRSYFKRQRQERKDRKAPPQRISDREQRRRVDEFYDWGQQKKASGAAQAVADEKAKTKGLPKEERVARIQERGSAARGEQQKHVDRELARTFGSHWQVTRKPKGKVKKTGETEKSIRVPTAAKAKKTGETEIAIRHPEPPPRETYIAERPKPAHGDPDPTVEGLTRNLKPKATAKPTGKAALPKGYKIADSGDPKAKWELIAPDGRTVAIAPTKKELHGTARGDVAERAHVSDKPTSRRVAEPLEPTTLKVGHYKVKTKKGDRQVAVPKAAPEGGGQIHASRKDAQAVADEVPFDAKIVEIAGDTPGVTSGYAVVPKIIADRYKSHKNVGRGGYAVGPTLRVAGKQFRKTVLPLSLKWLLGQVSEAGIRMAAQGAGPADLLRYRKLMRELERVDPDAASKLRKQAVSGGLYGPTGAIGFDLIRDPGSSTKTLADEFAGTGLEKVGKGLTKAGALPVVRHTRGFYKAYSNAVFNSVNGRIEAFTKAGMLGHAVKHGPLMERRLLGLTDKAVKEAAQGLRGTSAQVELARSIDRAYGKYSKFGPTARDTILHSTPFIPWMRNMIEFNLKVLPQDHPVKAALVADLNAATEEQRKRDRLSTRGKHVPAWLLGSTKVGSEYLPLARFGPALPGDYASAVGGQYLPQIQGIQTGLSGLNWKGEKPENKSEEMKFAAAALAGAEALVPGVGPLNRATGLGKRYVEGKTKTPTATTPKKVASAWWESLYPKPIGLAEERSKKKKPKGKAPLGGGSSSGKLPLGGGAGGAKLPLGGG